MIELELIEVLFDSVLRGRVREVALVDARRRLHDRDWMPGHHAVLRDRRGVDDLFDARLHRGAEDVFAPLDVHCVEQLARDLGGDDEREVDQRVGAGEVSIELGVADVGSDRFELPAHHERRMKIEREHALHLALIDQTPEHVRSQLPGTTRYDDSHPRD
jgi:hypothetical protein